MSFCQPSAYCANACFSQPYRGEASELPVFQRFCRRMQFQSPGRGMLEAHWSLKKNPGKWVKVVLCFFFVIWETSGNFSVKLQVFKLLTSVSANLCKLCWLNLNFPINCLNICTNITSVKWNKPDWHGNIFSDDISFAVAQVFMFVMNFFRGMEALITLLNWSGFVFDPLGLRCWKHPCPEHFSFRQEMGCPSWNNL